MNPIEGFVDEKPFGPDQLNVAPGEALLAVNVAFDPKHGVASSNTIVGAAGAPGLMMLKGPKSSLQEFASVI
jgi:hypothetical protein